MPEETPFIDYVNAVEALLEATYAQPILDAGIELNELASAQEELFTPAEFVEWFAEKRDLTPIAEWNWGKTP